ncbi:YciI family protein [Sneathiella chungangensis]|uniref:YciI family protein n=1 Tax=Sneathiella chungangensis TaxID=1418234 RepID=A0A845MLJ9_9PROT|nr:YciI family protein [Sneathiella chungangensis]MZR23947.1 YciI family protein [Sneathiella chungangensis]
MLFIAHCTDKAGHLQVRLDTRPDHLAFLAEKGSALKIGGPTLAEDGETPNGSLLIFEDTDLKSAKAWVAKDPYGAAGLFESVIVQPWKHAIGGGL